MSSKELMNIVAEDKENRTGERDFEFERRINHFGLGEEEDIFDILGQFGY